VKDLAAPLVVVSGAGQRIGLDLTERFAREGRRVLALIRSPSTALCSLASAFPHLIAIQERDLAQNPLDASFWNEAGPGLEGFVHCASMFEHDRVNDAQPETLSQHEAIHADAFIHACRSFVQSQPQAMPKAPGFVAVVDVKVKNLNPDHFSYTLSKLHLASSIEFLAMACAPFLRVNAVSPGLILPSGEQSLEDFEAARAAMPFGHGADLVDIHQAVAFLMRQPSATGQILDIDAGQRLASGRDIIFTDHPSKPHGAIDSHS
jgi:NAD(P)-dependent dehydrogenase (short-subunit alcohol dehydrogenase family)